MSSPIPAEMREAATAAVLDSMHSTRRGLPSYGDLAGDYALAALTAVLPHLPQRVSPSVEDAARAIDPAAWRYATYPVDLNTEAWDLYARRRDRSLQAARRVLALVPGPTVEQVRREALAAQAVIEAQALGLLDVRCTHGAMIDRPCGLPAVEVLDAKAPRCTMHARARATEVGEPS